MLSMLSIRNHKDLTKLSNHLDFKVNSFFVFTYDWFNKASLFGYYSFLNKESYKKKKTTLGFLFFDKSVSRGYNVISGFIYQKKKKQLKLFFQWLNKDLSFLLGQNFLFIFTFAGNEKSLSMFKWNNQVFSFDSTFGLLEAVLSRRLRSYVYFLRNYLESISMFKHRLFIMQLTMSLRSFLQEDRHSILGYSFFFSGKISVSGNARTRTMGCHRGYRSLSCLFVNSIGSWGIVNTPTGCLGFCFQFFF